MIIPILLKSRNYLKLITCSHFLSYKKWMQLNLNRKLCFRGCAIIYPVLCLVTAWESLASSISTGHLRVKLPAGWGLLSWRNSEPSSSRQSEAKGDPQMMGRRRCICFHSVFQKDVKWFIFCFRNGPSLHFPFGLCYILIRQQRLLFL